MSSNIQPRRPIIALSERTIARVRAGEVVSSISSACKELVENALDAGATVVVIKLSPDGSDSLSVMDNGPGIPRHELPLALQSHATSKLDDDASESIRWLGFRGEALASIASVSLLTLSSRVEDDVAWEIRSDHGDLSDIRPAMGLVERTGTFVVIKELFRHVPARAKFQRPLSVERGRIQEMLQGFALLAPDVNFTFYMHNKQVAQYLAASPDTRLTQVLGPDFLTNAYQIVVGNADLQLRMNLGTPTSARRDSRRFTFVNGRIVKDPLLHTAVKQALSDVMPDAFIARALPPYTLDLWLPASEIDPNAHPEKAIVRFRDERKVHDAVVEAIKTAMVGEQSDARRSLSQSAATLTSDFIDQAQKSGARRDGTGELGRALAVVDGVFAIGVRPGSLSIVDIHAAHERLVYEKLKDGIRNEALARTQLVAPVTVHVGFEGVEDIMFWQDEMSELGLELEADGDALILKTVPTILGIKDPTDMISELVANIRHNRWGNPLGKALDRVCSLMACHNAIRRGDVINLATVDALFTSMEENGLSAFCNHGRPTAHILDGSGLGALFHRS